MYLSKTCQSQKACELGETMIIHPPFIWLPLLGGIATGRTSFRKSHPPSRDRVRKSVGRDVRGILRINAGGTSLRKSEEDGSTSRLARRTENDPIITACLHNDTPFKSERKRERATPKTNQTGRDGIRGPPGATTDGFTLVHIKREDRRREPRCKLRHHLVYIQRTENHPGQGGGGAAALTLCYDKYIFLFVLLIRYPAPTNQGTCHRPARTIDGENNAREPQALFANNVMMSVLFARCYKNIGALVNV